MAIVVTATYQEILVTRTGAEIERGTLAITGLTANAANTIPHGLPRVPRRVSLRPGAAGLWGETSAPDATNIYVTVGAGGATAGTIDVEY